MQNALEHFACFTKATETELHAKLVDIRKRGYAERNEEIDLGFASVAAPIFAGIAGDLFSIGTVDPIRRFCGSDRKIVGSKLTEPAGRISKTIQHRHLAEA